MTFEMEEAGSSPCLSETPEAMQSSGAVTAILELLSLHWSSWLWGWWQHGLQPASSKQPSEACHAI